MKYVPFGKVITVSKGEKEEEEEKLTKGLAFVRRTTTTTIKKEMKRREWSRKSKNELFHFFNQLSDVVVRFICFE
jgi:hypothetical protein